ncbi:MAG: alpha-hydroxy-acid oxidizing protein, partial [Nitratireductor sp.]|nr:alpha-hydroxy-acid oxidizing protein [Nitratireductor sp.]
MTAFGDMTPAERLEHVPAIEDLCRLAKRRMPHFAWEYLDSGTGFETAVQRNRDCLDQVLFKPRGLQGTIRPELSTSLFGRTYDLPFGMAPVGMTGLMWPGAELMLARSAKRTNIPYCLSTVACETPEAVGSVAGENGWFQLYTFADWAINEDLLKRAADSGFSALVITVDLPAPSMRERQRRA